MPLFKQKVSLNTSVCVIISVHSLIENNYIGVNLVENEKIYVYRIVAGIVLWFSNNEITWKIINYFTNMNNRLNVGMIGFFRAVFTLISFAGLIITLLSAILLLKCTMLKKKV